MFGFMIGWGVFWFLIWGGVAASFWNDSNVETRGAAILGMFVSGCWIVATFVAKLVTLLF